MNIKIHIKKIIFRKAQVLNIIVILPLLFSSCNNPVTPPPQSEPDSTSHEIIWEADSLGGFASNLRAVWGISPNDVWAAGWISRGPLRYNFVHYDGVKWEDYDYFEAVFNGMFGLSANNIWAVGNNPFSRNRDALIAHYDGNDWKTILIDIGTPSLNAVWASSSSDVFAVGDSGTIMHYDGANWTIMQTGWNGNLNDIWGFDANNIYACGCMNSARGNTAQPLLLHYDGNSWESILDTINYPQKYIKNVWGTSPDNVYFHGSYNQTGLYQGNINSGWQFIPTPANSIDINRIRGSSEYNILLVGENGIVEHYNGINWKIYTEFLTIKSRPTLRDAMVFRDTIFLVGNQFNEQTEQHGIVYKGIIKN